jgi:hypothetical protein
VIVAAMDLITLADLPALPGTDAKPSTRIVIGRLDDNLRDPRYGKFSITQADVDSWKRNLAGVFGGEVSFDFDHSSDRGQGTKAAAWISNIDQAGTENGSLITADAQFTRAGAKAVRNGDYKYTSPTFVENYTDEHGAKHGKALIGGALTNRPVLRAGMPTLSLSKDTFEGVATASETTSAKRERKRARKLAATALARDSRGQMDKLAELRKLLGLADDADHVTILAAAAGLKPGDDATPAVPVAPVTLDAAAPAKAARKAAKKAAKQTQTLSLAPGATTLSAEQLADLITAANAGQAASLQLAEQTFTTAWEKACSEGRAAPSQEDTMRALYRENADLAVKTLDAFVAIVPIKPSGSGEGATGPAPLGMDDDRFALHTQAKTLAASKMAADPTLDEAAAYTMSVVEIEDRKFMAENPGI